MVDRFVIYRDDYGTSKTEWAGAAEYTVRGWFKKETHHAPVTHASTAEEVFAWLLKKYPSAVIAYDPAVSRRYSEPRKET